MIQPRKDVVLVGYGGAGAPAAHELAAAGLSVVALEQGPHRTTEQDFQTGSFDTLRWIGRREMISGPDRTPMTFRQSEDAAAKQVPYHMAAGVGGSAVHWSGQSWRYYEDDFAIGSMAQRAYAKGGWLDHLHADGAELPDWPLTYDELEPYYDKAEYSLGIGGWPGNIGGKIRPVNPVEGNPFEAPRRRDFPFRPLRDNTTNLVFRRGAEALGLKPFHVPTAIVTDPQWVSSLGIARADCTYCSFCTGHGCWNGSKSTPLSAILPATQKLANFELRSGCRVTRLNWKNNRIISVSYIDGQGQEQEQPGDLFLLGAYTYQNIRLLLHSGLDGNGQVGKYFLTRPSISLAAAFDGQYLNGTAGPAVQRQGVDDFNGENARAAKLALGPAEFFLRGGFICAPTQHVPLESIDILPPDVPRWGAAYKDFFSRNLNRLMTLNFYLEPIPHARNRIDLDPDMRDRFGMPAARVTNAARQNELRMGRFLYARGEAILRAAGASRIWGNATARAVAGMTHDLGGARMGLNGDVSATNRYGQLWTHPNLFVLGGALHPTMGGHNPTETITAISYWIAAAILDRRANPADAARIT